MTKHSKNLAKITLLTSLVWPASVWAADQNEAAPAAAAATGGLEDIIVTARKREERAQDTPISLTVTTGQQLENRSVTSFTELQQQTPSLHMGQTSISATAVNLSMRGQSVTDFRLNIDPAVGVYIDGVYIPRSPGLTAATIADLARVEVLAGPQGTLYGKNTTGGALAIYTQEPKLDTFEGSVRGLYASYGERSLTGVLNVPAGDGLAVRVLGNMFARDGFGHNTLRDERTGRYDSYYFRGAALYEPTDNLRVTLRGDYANTKVIREAWKGLLALAPLTPGVGLGGSRVHVQAAMQANNIATLAAFNALPLATRTTLLQQADTALRSYSQGDPDDSQTNSPAYENIKVWGVSGTIDLDLTDNISIKSITAYRKVERQSAIDQDGTPFTIVSTIDSVTTDDQFSEEFQIAGSFLDGRLKSIAGVFYSKEEGREDVTTISIPALAGVTATNFQEADVGNSSLGFFTQHTMNFTDQLSATAGIRYTKDKRHLTAYTHNAINCTALGVSLASLPNGLADCVRDMRVSYNRISYTAGLEYRPTEDIMLYAKTSRGYRSGGLQQTGAGSSVAEANEANTPFKPETIQDYEAGVKSEFFDKRLRVNISYYHSKVKNAQRNAGRLIPGTLTVVSSLRNAASVLIDGVEFDITARPVPGLELSANGAYTDARYKSYVTAAGDFSNVPVVLSPKWQFGGSAAYTFDIGKASWRNQLDYSWTSRQLTAEPSSPTATVFAYSPKHGILDGRTALTFDEHNLEVALFVKNITNKRFIVYPSDVFASLGFIWSGGYNPPRKFGVEVSAKF